jgi:hypothetical protein
MGEASKIAYLGYESYGGEKVDSAQSRESSDERFIRQFSHSLRNASVRRCTRSWLSAIACRYPVKAMFCAENSKLTVAR